MRTTLLIVASWAIVAAPLLCMTGMLAHACPCEDDHAEACDHEADCDLDPCAEQVLRKEEPRATDPGAGHLVAACPAPPSDGSLPERRDPKGSAPPDPVPPHAVPHPSDLPLLS